MNIKLALVISSLGGGGAERVMATLANAWINRGWSVTLITLSTAEKDEYALDPKVKRIGLGMLHESRTLYDAVRSNWRRIRVLRKALLGAQPDVVLSFLTTTNMLSVLACYRTGIPVVVSERISLEDQPPRPLWNSLYRTIYRRAAGIATLTKHGATQMEARLKTTVAIIPNPVVVTPRASSTAAVKVPLHLMPAKFKLLAMGRLTSQKGFDLLVDAFARIAPTHPDWSLTILGEGPNRSDLEGLAKSCGVADRVAMPGFFDRPQDIMRAADAFVLSSRYEGMPNALIEAMAVGLPCVSFDCRTGPSELIKHGVSGLLVPPEDVSALAACLSQIFGDRHLRERLGTEASAAVARRFNIESVICQWENLLLSAAVIRQV